MGLQIQNGDEDSIQTAVCLDISMILNHGFINTSFQLMISKMPKLVCHRQPARVGRIWQQVKWMFRRKKITLTVNNVKAYEFEFKCPVSLKRGIQVRLRSKHALNSELQLNAIWTCSLDSSGNIIATIYSDQRKFPKSMYWN